MKIHNVTQGTEEWLEVRKLKLTASNGTAIATAGAGLETLVKKLILESIIPQERYLGKDMERGHELEPLGRLSYELEFDVEVKEVGFVEHTEHSGCSPDGLVGEDGLIEIKARNDEKHLSLILTDKIDTGVVWQMQMQMLVCNRKWCDFVSYNPNFKKSLYVQRIKRDEVKIQKIILGMEKGTKRIKEYLNNNNIKSELS